MTDKPDKYPDQIFVRNNLTAREELMFASAEISSLKIENGKLLAEIDHLNAQIDILKRSVAVTHEDNVALRKEEMIVQLKKQLKKQIKENLLLKKTNSDLAGKIYQLAIHPHNYDNNLTGKIPEKGYAFPFMRNFEGWKNLYFNKTQQGYAVKLQYVNMLLSNEAMGVYDEDQLFNLYEAVINRK